MIITNPNGSGILFSRNCADLVISSLPDGCRDLSIRLVCDGRECSFKATPFSGKVNVHLSEILRGVETGAIFDVEQTDSLKTSYAHKIEVHASADSASVSWTGYYMPGGSDLQQSVLSDLRSGKYWWSFRKQSAPTFKFSREFLVAAINASSSVSIRLTFHFATAGKVTSTWRSGLTSSQSNPSLMIIDCSYKRVRAYADSLGYTNDTIIAYDVTGVAGSASYPVGQRFVVAPNDSRVRGWCFRNSLGGYDTVHSFGALTRSVDSEVKTFTTGHTSAEIENFSKEVWNVDTGYVADQKELNLWFEFLRSKERYFISADGTLSKIIVDENDSDSKFGTLGSLSFKCRFAKETTGYDFTKSVLEEFSDEYT